MKVFVAGATGAIGRPLIEALNRAGHRVTAMVRSRAEAEQVRRLGADPVLADALEKAAVEAALRQARPDAVIDELTHLPTDPAGLDAALPADSRLRLEGGGNVFAAAEALGVRRYLQQSCGFYLQAVDALADEQAPLRLDAPSGIGMSARMYAELEQRVLGASRVEGTALRYGFFYGPSTWYWNDGAVAEQVRRGEAPIVGGGTAVWSFVHVGDAARATVSALDAAPGIYNIVDDDPQPVSRWLPAFADWVGAGRPAAMSAETAAKQAGDEVVYLQTALTGASNAKAKRDLGFSARPLVWS